jgi:hypothetical protein
MATKPAAKKAPAKKGAKSGNPATRAAAQNKVSSASSFKNKRTTILELPSGESMRVKNPGGLKLFMREGMIPNSLMGLMQGAVDTGAKPDMSQIVTPDGVDPELVEDMLGLLDNILVTCALEPRVHPVPEDEEEDPRDDELLYTDEVDEEDKMFIFQWVVGGTRDVEQFRSELTSELADLGAVQAVEGSSK